MFLDLSAAFDCVDHTLLLHRLYELGIRDIALDWFRTYLSGRTQSVAAAGVVSTPLGIATGVPQGSVLGPILFNVYLSRLHEVIHPHGVSHVIYADDIQLYASASLTNLAATINRLEACVQDVKSYLASLWLTLNDSKTEFIVLGTKRAVDRLDGICFNTGSTTIPPSSVVRDLGFLIDSTLRFEHQVNKIRSSAFGRLRLIARVRRYWRRRDCNLLVKSLVLSHLTYCMPLLSGLSCKSLSSLQLIINASIRLIHGIKKGQSISWVQNEEKWLSISSLIKLRILLLTFKILQSGQPVYLHSLLQHHLPTRSLRSADQHLLRILRTKKVTTDAAFSHAAPKLWNALSPSIRALASLTSFKSACILSLI